MCFLVASQGQEKRLVIKHKFNNFFIRSRNCIFLQNVASKAILYSVLSVDCYCRIVSVLDNVQC